MPSRIFLSPPDVGDAERALLLEAFDSGWVAPAGPQLDAFEAEMAAFVGVGHAVALTSGTAALHLALVHLGVGRGDDVLVASLTFAASAFAVVHAGARPCFLDSEPETWNLDPDLLAEELHERASAGRLPAAVMPVDLYGQCADHHAIAAVCDEYGVPVVADAAEALGATRNGKPAGSFGRVAALSFNGNKIVTTGGGGMLLSDDAALAAHARRLANQARDPALHYEHSEVGFNYRLGNLAAAIGRAQLARLPSIVGRRRAIAERYAAALAGFDGFGLQPVAPANEPNHWLTVATVDHAAAGITPVGVCEALERADIEARPAWKPMHLQPVFADAPMRGGAVGEWVYAHGLCLPSGSSMTDADVDRVLQVLADARP